MPGDVLYFVGFALAYTAAWWTVARHAVAASAPAPLEVRAPRRPRRRRRPAAPATLGGALTQPAGSPAFVAESASDSSPGPAQPDLGWAPGSDVSWSPTVAAVGFEEPAEIRPAPPADPRTQRVAPPDDGATDELLTQGMNAMESQPLEFPNWMNESQAAEAREKRPESAPPAPRLVEPAPRAAEPVAALPKLAPTPVAQAASTQATAAASAEATATALKGHTQVERERQKCMSELDAWVRTWTEFEKRNASLCNELAQRVEALGREHAGCEERARATDQRAQGELVRAQGELKQLRTKLAEIEPLVQQAKELQASCTTLERDLAQAQSAAAQAQSAASQAQSEVVSLRGTNEQLSEQRAHTESEMQKLRDHLARNQEAFREVTARELDWQKRYHEDTNKLMNQLAAKAQEAEVAQGASQARERALETAQEQCEALTQENAAHQKELEERDRRIRELEQQCAQIAQEAAEYKKNQDQAAAMMQAAQGVLAELRPKLQALETQFSKQS